MRQACLGPLRESRMKLPAAVEDASVSLAPSLARYDARSYVVVLVCVWLARSGIRAVGASRACGVM